MNKVDINVIRKDADAKMPVYATECSSGADVVCVEDFTLVAGERRLVHTGLFMQLPEGVECQVRPRSGLALKHGITVLNSPGTIDSDYRGECCVILCNFGNEAYTFKKGERIAQFVFVSNVLRADFHDVNEFTDTTERGEGGFSHTGK